MLPRTSSEMYATSSALLCPACRTDPRRISGGRTVCHHRWALCLLSFRLFSPERHNLTLWQAMTIDLGADNVNG
jgi:hypothetical protein